MGDRPPEVNLPFVVKAAVELALPSVAGVDQVQGAGGALEAALVEGVLHHAHDVAITNWLAAVGALARRGRMRRAKAQPEELQTQSLTWNRNRTRTHSRRRLRCAGCRRRCCWRRKAVHSIEAALSQGDAVAEGRSGSGSGPRPRHLSHSLLRLMLLVYGVVAAAAVAVVVAATSVDISAE